MGGVFGQCMGLVRDDSRCQWVSAWPLNVQYVGGEGVSWTDVGVKGWTGGCQGGARCEGVSCEVSVCEMVSRRSGRRSRSGSGSLNGV